MSFANEQPPIAQHNVWAAHSLRTVVADCLTDPRFAGMAKFIINVDFYWTRMIPTAAAGYGMIFFNPDFFDSIPVETRKTVIMHEIMHLILKHLDRGKDHDPRQFNIAADHVINNTLEDEGFTFEGTSPFKDPKFKNHSTEQVYNIIYEKVIEDPTKAPEDPNYVSAEAIEDLIKDALNAKGEGKDISQQKAKADADIASSNPGLSPGNNIIELEATKNVIAIIGSTYKEIFKKYLVDPLGGNKRTFVRPNRRQHNASSEVLKLPGKFPRRGHLNRLTHLVYALDVSGSITEKQAKQFHQSVYSIKKLLNPAKLTVMLFDTRVVFQKTYTDREDYNKIRVAAGGGTNLTDVFAKTEILKPEALVIFTDLEVAIPPQPEWDCIWIIPEKHNRVPPDIYGNVYLIPDEPITLV